MMNEINVVSGEQSFNGEKIRYIEFNGNKYFLYTLNEKDNEGYEKLYINKIIDNEEDVITDSEWEELKNNIPTIVKETIDITKHTTIDTAFKIIPTIFNALLPEQIAKIKPTIGTTIINRFKNQDKIIAIIPNTKPAIARPFFFGASLTGSALTTFFSSTFFSSFLATTFSPQPGQNLVPSSTFFPHLPQNIINTSYLHKYIITLFYIKKNLD